MNYGIRSILTSGFEGTLIEIECQLSNGLPTMIIVGLGNKAIDEAKERIRSAFVSSKIVMPRKRITINLAPADIPKESTSLDLAIAAAILRASSDKIQHNTDDSILIGELGLNGDVRPVRGIIGKIIAASRLGVHSFIVPWANASQASLVPNVTVYPIKHIKELSLHLYGEQQLKPYIANITLPEAKDTYSSLSSVAGQSQAKRALEIAAAGGHNILLCGPPGTGKSMLAKALPRLLPELTLQEILEVTHLHSLASSMYDRLITSRPFRSPHHSASNASIVGGGNNVLPGEITLSHRGVLFMDELPEFDRETIEALRQPLEDKTITIARAKRTVNYPANFIMVATANPCPCGYYGSSKECRCTPARVQQYQRKLSGPILDRIDLFIQVDTIDHSLLLSSQDESSEDKARQDRINRSRKSQAQRLKSSERLNATMTNEEVRSCSISDEATSLLNKAASTLDISARAYIRILKVARTIADLEQSPTIEDSHISEALQYRELRMINQ